MAAFSPVRLLKDVAVKIVGNRLLPEQVAQSVSIGVDVTSTISDNQRHRPGEKASN